MSKSVTRTPKGWQTTLNTWLSKEQNQKRPGGPSGQTVPQRSGHNPGYAVPVRGKYGDE